MGTATIYIMVYKGRFCRATDVYIGITLHKASHLITFISHTSAIDITDYGTVCRCISISYGTTRNVNLGIASYSRLFATAIDTFIHNSFFTIDVKRGLSSNSTEVCQ